MAENNDTTDQGATPYQPLAAAADVTTTAPQTEPHSGAQSEPELLMPQTPATAASAEPAAPAAPAASATPVAPVAQAPADTATPEAGGAASSPVFVAGQQGVTPPVQGTSAHAPQAAQTTQTAQAGVPAAYGGQASPAQSVPAAPGQAAQNQAAPAHPAPAAQNQAVPSQAAQSHPAPVFGAGSGGSLPPAGGAPGAAFTAPTREKPQEKKHRGTGLLLAGLAAGAIIGGVVGGGVSAIVVSNGQSSSNPVVQQNGAVTLNNPRTATEISGVAMVATPSVVTLQVDSANASGSGSGVVYSEDGYIITNAHVVTLDGAASDAKIRVKFSDGRLLDGTVVGVAPYSDIAVVKVEAEGLQAIDVADSSKVNVGDLAVAIGAPMSLSNTVTSGVVSALNRGISVGSPLIPEDQAAPDEQPDDQGRGFPWDFRFETPGENEQRPQASGQVTLPVIQTDASINPGNSGGALLNGKGELIGINVAIASPGASEGAASSAGLGFAIPSELATRIADEIIAGEQPSHGVLGASVVDASYDAGADHAGGLIKELVSGGSAARAGLKVGDVITAVNGIPAADGTSVSALIRMQAGGTEVTIDYTREGAPGQVTTELGTLDW